MTNTPSILILGAGSQAKVVADLLLTSGEYTPLGCIEIGNDPARIGSQVLGIPVLAGIDQLADIVSQHGVQFACVAIGDNRARARLIELARQAGLKLPVLRHPSAVVAQSAEIGEASVIAAQAVIGVEAKLGEGAIVNTSASVDHDCVLGRCVHIAVGSHLAGTVQAGDYVTFGAGSSAIPGVRVGSDVTVGAGAAVVSDLPDGVTALGVPAKAR